MAQSSRRLLTPTLPDRYLLGDPIGHSGGARVWAATDTATGDKVAVKTPLYADNYDAHLPKRLADEYRIASAFRHPHIMRVLDMDVTPGEPYSPYLVAELVDGQTFQSHRDARGAVGIDQVATIGLQLTDALRTMHAAGWVHRDVKSENVMFTGDGRVKLIDLGAAARTGDRDAEFVFGADGYVAPEIERAYRARLNRRDVELPLPHPSTDVYGAGVLLYEASTGVHTRTTLAHVIDRTGDGLPPLGRVVDNVPDALGRLVADMTASSRGDRPTAAEAHAALREIAARLPDGPSTPRVARSRSRTHGPQATRPAESGAAPPPVPHERSASRTGHPTAQTGRASESQHNAGSPSANHAPAPSTATPRTDGHAQAHPPATGANTRRVHQAVQSAAAGFSSGPAEKPTVTHQHQSPTTVNTRVLHPVPTISPYKTAHDLRLARHKTL
ncbi:protein kinase [Yinghuangia sp. ASG 101]|uniref:serine/threonine-protein kinase n=1 Tax=Yinghuangia sp. ASG 101 TaxID=2896848 RepID=UPI001E4127D3|nr:serine/threonine-protein kinase [Yinghuangia sp. ASG 101]UGQ11336.1 protein kinase [Yinghuangia sp. ASG 101]